MTYTEDKLIYIVAFTFVVTIKQITYTFRENAKPYFITKSSVVLMTHHTKGFQKSQKERMKQKLDQDNLFIINRSSCFRNTAQF